MSERGSILYRPLENKYGYGLAALTPDIAVAGHIPVRSTGRDRACLCMRRIIFTGTGLAALCRLGRFFRNDPFAPVMAGRRDRNGLAAGPFLSVRAVVFTDCCSENYRACRFAGRVSLFSRDRSVCRLRMFFIIRAPVIRNCSCVSRGPVIVSDPCEICEFPVMAERVDVLNGPGLFRERCVCKGRRISRLALGLAGRRS